MITTLLIEDDRAMATSVAEYLSLNHISVDHAYNGKAGLNLATSNNYDVILLDLMLPKMDGLTVCQQLRKTGVDTPVLMLTALDTLDDKLAGFDAGTDDYLVKPYAMKELMVRIRALANRRSGQVYKYTIGDLVVDFQARTVSRSGTPIQLSPSSWTILESLVKSSPNVVTYQQIEQALWGEESPDSNSLKVLIHKLRQRVDKPFDTAMIQTVPGQGLAIREGN